MKSIFRRRLFYLNDFSSQLARIWDLGVSDQEQPKRSTIGRNDPKFRYTLSYEIAQDFMQSWEPRVLLNTSPSLFVQNKNPTKWIFAIALCWERPKSPKLARIRPLNESETVLHMDGMFRIGDSDIVCDNQCTSEIGFCFSRAITKYVLLLCCKCLPHSNQYWRNSNTYSRRWTFFAWKHWMLLHFWLSIEEKLFRNSPPLIVNQVRWTIESRLKWKDKNSIGNLLNFIKLGSILCCRPHWVKIHSVDTNVSRY